MFQLRKIELTNFRSYKGTHSFEFPLLRGLYFLTGSNNTELGSNGSGKSTLLDAIIWALYNRTARGLKANEVISWGATNCSVALELTIGPAEFIIKRSQKPNALSINGNPVDQDELQKYIRLNFDSFLYSVINPQFGESFLALSPTAKLILFSDIMGLDFWLEKSDAAAKKADLISWQVEELKRILNQLEGQRTALVDEIKHIKEAASTFDSNQKVKIATIKQEIATPSASLFQ
jgi:DNA repair exonuclease SbcCD ATPase subunit